MRKVKQLGGQWTGAPPHVVGSASEGGDAHHDALMSTCTHIVAADREHVKRLVSLRDLKVIFG